MALIQGPRPGEFCPRKFDNNRQTAMVLLTLLLYISSFTNDPISRRSTPLQFIADADVAIQRSISTVHFVDEVPGAADAEVMAIALPDRSLVLADRGPFPQDAWEDMAPPHWIEPMGTRLLRMGEPVPVSDRVFRVTYRGTLRGRAVTMDLLVGHQGRTPTIRLRILRQPSGSAPVPPLIAPLDLLDTVQASWPGPDTAPLTTPEPMPAPSL